MDDINELQIINYVAGCMRVQKQLAKTYEEKIVLTLLDFALYSLFLKISENQ